MYQAVAMPEVQWETTMNDYSPRGLSDADGNSQVLMLSIPGEYVRDGPRFAFADDANGRQSKKALSILVRLWLEGNRTISNAKKGIDANESEEEEGKWNKKGAKGGKEKESSVEAGVEEADLGGDSTGNMYMDQMLNKEGSVRLVYMGLRSEDNKERILKHTWWLIKKGGGATLDMNSRLEHVIEKNRRRESVFQRKKS